MVRRIERTAAAVFALCLLSACSTYSKPQMLQTIAGDLSEQYHDCVPLGWNIAPVTERLYYPGYTSEYREQGVWIPPAWLGIIRSDELVRPDVRAAYNLLEALVRAGMAQKTQTGGQFRYRLTMRAIPYFFEDGSYRNNPDHLPYLCYSRIVPTAVRSVRRIDAKTVRVVFDWKAVSIGNWAPTPFLRKHSAVLPPISNPAVAIVVNSQGDEYVSKIETSAALLPIAADPAAWP